MFAPIDDVPQDLWLGLSLSDWLGVAGLVLGTIGFVVTIWQLVRTARATEATAKAVKATEERVAVNYLLVLLPQFRIIESDLDNAAVEDDRRLAMRSLLAYTHVATEVRGLLNGRDNVDDALLTILETTATSASATKAALVTYTSRPTKTVTKEFRVELGQVSTFIGTLVTQFTLRTENG